MNLQERIDLLSHLGEYILSGEQGWLDAKEKAGYENGWFIPEFVDHATITIANNFLQKDILQEWVSAYPINTSDERSNSKTVMTEIKSQAKAQYIFFGSIKTGRDLAGVTTYNRNQA